MMQIDFFTLKNHSTNELKQIAEKVKSDYFFLQIEPCGIEVLPDAEKHFLQTAFDTQSAMLYSDYYQVTTDGKKLISTIEHQKGSIRDDFNFGALLLLKTDIFKQILKQTSENYLFAGFYDLRLKISEVSEIFHIAEPLYVAKQYSTQNTETQQFAYVDKKNRNVQIEMETACTEYLKRIGAFLEKEPKYTDLHSQTFEYEASVIIPVKNRERTISDAINSAIKQKTNFKFNILIINNFSTDKTGEIITEITKEHNNVFHIIPDNQYLGIGGCWNLAINNEKCGKFAVQLDSDDIYQSENTLQTIVNEFYKQNAAMIIGSYTITDFDLIPIPPYLIDHAEWTEQNGRNNALRINGLGAPRAFFTPIIRQIGFPNVSYGEDYAVALRICREWKIGRIFDSIYLCRRWESNSDANISPETINRYNFYKDKIRTVELLGRIKANE